MARILLLTFNARYHHAAFGLRYLKANLGHLADDCQIIEFDLDKRPIDAVEAVLEHAPRIVGLSVYIWNVRQSLEFARTLKAVCPSIKLVLGGPEISYEYADQPIAKVADHIICGEGDLAFVQLCNDLLADRSAPRILTPPPPGLDAVSLPYDLYTDHDIRHRTLYVESSRGCPFACEFCLSSLDIPVRQFPLEAFLTAMQRLLDRGARQFKFVDRTFNIRVDRASAILRFFLDRMTPGLFLHFEMIPDRLPEEVRELLTQFPPGSLQLEIGVQSFNPDVTARIGRRQDNARVHDNFRFLRDGTHAHLHADLIAGLPGETLESLAAGFDQLWKLRPHEIQFGILKRLRGAPIARHTDAFDMIYSPNAPYEILQNRDIDFALMQRLKRMARYWDLFVNSGNFRQSLSLLLGDDAAFWPFLKFSDALYAQTGQTHAISLSRQFELLFDQLGRTPDAGEMLAADYLRPGRRDLPGFLQPYARSKSTPRQPIPIPSRQARHMEGT